MREGSRPPPSGHDPWQAKCGSGGVGGDGVGWSEARKPHRLSPPPVPGPSLPTDPASAGRGWRGPRGWGRGRGATVATTDRSRTVILHKPSYFLKHNYNIKYCSILNARRSGARLASPARPGMLIILEGKSKVSLTLKFQYGNRMAREATIKTTQQAK